MALRINHNVSSINAQRQLTRSTGTQAKTLERLASGLKVNRGADGPAALVISERLRSQIAGVRQAIDNSETSISMVQTTEAALDEVGRALVSARQVAIHAANEGVNDEVMLQADQSEIENVLDTLDRISAYTQFGTKRLLDGSRGANGVANGKNLEWVSATTETKTSPITGYKVRINQAASRAFLKGTVKLTQEIINAEETITISENGRNMNFTTVKGESVNSTLDSLELRIAEAGLNLELVRTEEGSIHLRHRKFGSEHSFSAASSTAGILSKVGYINTESIRGKDVNGTINGEETLGRGQVLTGRAGTKNIEGLSVRYTGTDANVEPEDFAGTVTISQNSLIFQVGGNANQTTGISLTNTSSRGLSRAIPNKSGFEALRDIDVRTAQGAQDSIKLIDAAVEKISSTRGSLGAFQKNNLESNLNYLRIAHENLTNAESVLRDADMAEEMSSFTKNQIMVQTGTAMLAQANQTPQAVLTLLS
ncbi:MAG: flagellin [SAR324 cluster bacterium]|nr:flagellin [SAR324 cluster bacterium]